MKSKSNVPALCVAASLTAILAAAPAANAAEDDANQLEEVVVTAQFRSQNLQDTPIAITAVTGEMMEQRNQTSIYQVAAQAPSVLLSPQSQTNGTGLLAFIRGVGQTDFNYAVEPGVGMYIDDVYYATVTGSNFDLMDLERVEILRGPQGTLAGRNSIGGAIKMYSRKPTGDGGGSVQFTYGTDNRIDARATGDLALIDDKLFMRVAAVSKSRDGFIDRMDYACTHPGSPLTTLVVGKGCKLGTLGGQSLTAGRLSLRWLASDAVEVNVIGDITNDSSEAGAAILYRATNTRAGAGFAPPTSPLYIQQNGVPYGCLFVPYGPYSCDPNVANNNPYMTYSTFIDSLAPSTQRPSKPVSIPPIQQLDQWGVSATVDWAISENYQLKYIGSYRRYDSSWGHDIDGSPLPSQQLLQTLNHIQWTQELRLNGSLFDDKLEFTVGGFYFDQEGTLEARVDLNYAGLDFIHGPDETPSTSAAVFTHVEFHITEGLSFVGGVRYTQDDKDYTYFRRNPNGTVPSCPGVTPPNFNNATSPPNCALAGLYDVSASYSGDSTDWRLGFNYRWNDSLMTYLQASTGYKGGGTNPRPFFPWQILTFEPETMTTYEVGAKSDLLDNRVRLNAAVFFNDYKDIILNLSVCNVAPPLPAAPCALPANVGAADVWGGELEANFRLGAGFSVDASASMLDFKYTDTGVATGVTTSMITPYTPEEKYSLGVMWEGDVGEAGSLMARADYAYQSAVHSSAINIDPWTRIPPYGIYNARFTWRSPETTWETSLEVNNIGDKLYYLSNSDASTNAGSTAYGPGMPRNWAVTIKRNFN